MEIAPSLHIRYGFKMISLNTQYESLEDPRNHGDIFEIVNNKIKHLGTAKKYLLLNDHFELKFEKEKKRFNWRTVNSETMSEVFGFDSGNPEPMKKRIYVIKDNIIKNNEEENRRFPTILIEQNGIKEYSNNIRINGKVSIIYDIENIHPIGGKVRIETDSEIENLEPINVS